MIYADAPGTYDVGGLDVVRQRSGVLAAVVPNAKGVVVTDPYRDQIGFVVAQAHTAERAAEILAEAKGDISFTPSKRLTFTLSKKRKKLSLRDLIRTPSTSPIK